MSTKTYEASTVEEIKVIIKKTIAFIDGITFVDKKSFNSENVYLTDLRYVLHILNDSLDNYPQRYIGTMSEEVALGLEKPGDVRPIPKDKFEQYEDMKGRAKKILKDLEEKRKLTIQEYLEQKAKLLA